jgi:hypothetical protein
MILSSSDRLTVTAKCKTSRKLAIDRLSSRLLRNSCLRTKITFPPHSMPIICAQLAKK